MAQTRSPNVQCICCPHWLSAARQRAAGLLLPVRINARRRPADLSQRRFNSFSPLQEINVNRVNTPESANDQQGDTGEREEKELSLKYLGECVCACVCTFVFFFFFFLLPTDAVNNQEVVQRGFTADFISLSVCTVLLNYLSH